MAVNAIIDEGKVTNIGTEDTSKKKSADSVDKEQFLNLLVAQMKYQDPLEPTDNTEYVSQLATFSELEQMQNLAKSSDLQRAYNLVGNLVTVTATNEATGNTMEVTGKVDSIIKAGTSVKLSVNDQLFSLDDVSQVWDVNYADAQALATEWESAYGKLPALSKLTAVNAASYQDTVQGLSDTYNEMSVYQRTFLGVESVSGLKGLIERLAEYGIEIKNNAFGISPKSAAADPNASNNDNTKTGTDNNTGTDTGSQDTGTNKTDTGSRDANAAQNAGAQNSGAQNTGTGDAGAANSGTDNSAAGAVGA